MKTTKKYFSPHVIMIGVLLLCSSCVGYEATQTTSPTLQTTENLVYLDLGLRLWIPCETISAEQLPSGRMRVYARFVNKADTTAECQIKVRYKDKTGRILDETSWMPFLLPRREVTQFENTSLVTGAEDFTVMLRETTN